MVNKFKSLHTKINKNYLKNIKKKKFMTDKIYE
jgi:hypothetical protein